jgi:hypothetical protein
VYDKRVASEGPQKAHPDIMAYAKRAPKYSAKNLHPAVQALVVPVVLDMIRKNVSTFRRDYVDDAHLHMHAGKWLSVKQTNWLAGAGEFDGAISGAIQTLDGAVTLWKMSISPINGCGGLRVDRIVRTLEDLED